jgi:hypothetical protein
MMTDGMSTDMLYTRLAAYCLEHKDIFSKFHYFNDEESDY